MLAVEPEIPSPIYIRRSESNKRLLVLFEKYLPINPNTRAGRVDISPLGLEFSALILPDLVSKFDANELSQLANLADDLTVQFHGQKEVLAEVLDQYDLKPRSMANKQLKVMTAKLVALLAGVATAHYLIDNLG